MAEFIECTWVSESLCIEAIYRHSTYLFVRRIVDKPLLIRRSSSNDFNQDAGCLIVVQNTILHKRIRSQSGTAIHRVVLVLQLDEDVLLLIDDVKPLFGYFPASSDISEEVLVEVPDVVCVRLIYLSDALSFDNLLNLFIINLGIKGQLDRVYKVLVELS